MMPEVKSVCREQFGGAFEAEGFSRTRIQLPGHGIEFRLSETTQVSSLGEVLSEQAIGIFVDATLPWAVRIGKVNFHAGRLGQALVLRHLLALIVSQRQALLRLDAIEDVAKATKRRLGAGIFHPGQHSEQRCALHQRANRRTIERPLDQIATPSGQAPTVLPLQAVGHEC